MLPNITLIGGSPCAGKSTLAKALSKKYAAQWISTDGIRSFMQELLPKDDSVLFYDQGLTVDEFFAKYQPAEIARYEYDQALAMQQGVLDFIKADVFEFPYVIEGIAVTPELITAFNKSNIRFSYRLIIENNIERLKKIIANRGLWDEAAKYPDQYKPLETEWVLEFGKILESRANDLNLKVDYQQDYPSVEAAQLWELGV